MAYVCKRLKRMFENQKQISSIHKRKISMVEKENRIRESSKIKYKNKRKSEIKREKNKNWKRKLNYIMCADSGCIGAMLDTDFFGLYKHETICTNFEYYIHLYKWNVWKKEEEISHAKISFHFYPNGNFISSSNHIIINKTHTTRIDEKQTSSTSINDRPRDRARKCCLVTGHINYIIWKVVCGPSAHTHTRFMKCDPWLSGK